MKILFLFAFLSLVAGATTIYVDSDSLSTANNSGLATLDLTGLVPANPEWAAALPGSDWISYGPTGAHDDPGYFSPPDGTEVTFTTLFTLNGTITGAILKVLADDSTSVILNGHTLIAADSKPGARCANRPVGCEASTEAVFSFAELDPYLVEGANILSFGVIQTGGSSFGLDFAGGIQVSALSDPPGDLIDPTPEPPTVAVLAGGLVALGALRRRKRFLRAGSSGNLRADARQFSPV
jgi:hypothetical protein